MYAAVQPRESLCILKRNIARTTIFGFLRILQILVGYLLRENKKTKNHEKNGGKNLFQGVFISREYAAVQIRIKAL
jgi:glucose uptake protein GlcU